MKGERRMKKLKMMTMMLLSVLLLTACAKDTQNKTEDVQNQDGAVTPQVTVSADNTDTDAAVTAGASETETQPQNKTDIRIAALKGPTAIGMVKVRTPGRSPAPIPARKDIGRSA
jgi:PBP1b-binding outer membrane lipoprotein LpoB